MRLRRESDLDPEIRRELEALDAAITGESLDPRHEDLAALAMALRDERPAPRPEFALDLDLRVRDGFPTPEKTPPPAKRHVPFRRRWGLALGTAASLFIVATAVLVSGIPDGSDDSGSAQRNERENRPYSVLGEERRQAPPSDKAAGRPVVSPPIPGPPAGSADRVRDRKVERGASLTLSTPRDQ